MNVLKILETLVACDSQNPPRDLTADSAMFGYLRDQLPGFAISVTDHGEGHVSFLARRGAPRLLFNVHLDTVPVGSGWSGDPLTLHVADGRARGRGACDIKGAAAVLLDLAASSEADVAFLFTTDEEGAGGCCVRKFCESGAIADYQTVVVAEPTLSEVVLAHRGYLSVTGQFTGIAGHSSEARGLAENALHRFSRWAGMALATVGETYPESRFNLGRIDGGIKSNVIADQVQVAWSARLPPGTDSDQFLEAIVALSDADHCSWQVPFLGPPLPAAGTDAGPVKALIEKLDLPQGKPVDFWTEAALFSAAGCQTFVLGPGDIAQAHAVDEWVSIEQLERSSQLYTRLINHHA